VVATIAPNLSTAMEVVETRKLQSKTIGVFTKCDKAMADEDDKETFLERLKSPPPRDCGAVELSPNGWVCVMNASVPAPSGPIENSSFSRLKQQAVDEEKFMRNKLPGVVRAGDAGCGALVVRISKMFTEFLSEAWGPKTIKLLSEAVAEAKRQEAALGLPAFHQGGGDKAKRAQELAAKEARRKIEVCTQRLMDDYCKQELAQLQRKLMEITGESFSNAVMSTVPARWRAQQDKFEAACKRGNQPSDSDASHS
jgi:hypothetical protein